MAEEVIITLKVEKNKADKALENVEKNTDKAKKSTEGLNKEAKKTPKALKGVSKGMKAIGSAIKAAGIGLLIGLLVKLGEVLSRNQKVVDFFDKAMVTLEIVFTELFNATENIYNSLSDNTQIFQNFGKVIMGLITLALTPLKLNFYTIKGAVLALQLAWEKSIFGSGDTEKIDELNKSLEENKESIIQVGVEALKAGKDVKDGAVGIVNEAGKAFDIIATEASKVNISNATEQADALVELRKQIRLQEAALEGLRFEYLKQQETFRQIRDSEKATIDERIKANEDLAQSLVDQANEERGIIEGKIGLIKQEIALGDNSIEKQEELIRASNELKDLEERINGFKSEQLINEESLLKLKEDNLRQINQIGKTERDLARKELENKFEDNKKLIERTISDDKELKEALLANQIAYDESVADLEEDQLQKIEDLKNKFIPEDEQGLSDQEKFELKLAKDRENFEKELELLEATEAKKAEIKEQYEEGVTKKKEEFNKEQEEDRKAVVETDIAMTIGAVGAITDALAEGSAAAKGFAVAGALYNTYEGITTALKEPTLPQRIAGIAFASAAGFGAVQDILSTSEDGSNANGRGGRGTTITQGPRFDTVSDSQNVRNAEREASQEKEPMEAYVVSGKITNQQELDRNKNNNSRFI